MMFKPDNRPYPADYLNLNVLNRAKRHPITDEDVRWIFAYGNAIWIRIYKVVRDTFGKVKLISRDYSLLSQKDEFICDMFDISLNHKIVAVAQPEDIFIEETDENDTNIDADMIEAIVGKID